ncbi:MAG: coproporphyrinogen dehydrogenase HemZ [Clostridiales bacterium]|nr:coproporphyrinogen dehydrogenase HemZ [Clostridiales bacterium]
MLEIRLLNHDNFYGVADVIRAFYLSPCENKDSRTVTCDNAPDITLFSEVGEGNTRCYSEDGSISYTLPFVTSPYSESREVKRSVYKALADIAGKQAPWGCLTGIRPTLVAGEEDDAEELAGKYFVRPDKARLALETFSNEQRILGLSRSEDINIYVGIPFCPSRCEYCSFISADIHHHMGRLKNYLSALEGEMSSVMPKLGRRVGSLYVGGGTPTVFDEEDFDRLMDAVFNTIKVDKDTEITVEAGRPDTITRHKLETMHSHGVRRICINPQTMNSETLSRLNRLHTAEDAVAAYEMARDVGFEVINMDLIAGLKYETSSDFVRSVERLIELDPENITIHTLYKKRRAAISAADVMGSKDDDVDSAVTEGHRLLKEAGYIPYYLYRQKDTGHGLENVGFAKPGTECIYNVAMMTDARDVLSFGAGGMSKRVFEQSGSKYRVERCPCIKDVIGYIDSWQDMAERKSGFFDIMQRD